MFKILNKSSILPAAAVVITGLSLWLGQTAAAVRPPATINVPRSGQVLSSLPVTVAGLCPSGSFVEIYRNQTFSGSAVCQNGSFSLQTDLSDGINNLVARVYDSLNQAGPGSHTVAVTFIRAVPSSGSQLSLASQSSRRGANPGSILSWPITLSGGTAPYAISVDWGDSSSPDLFSRKAAGNISLEHTYAQAGDYKVVVKASDADGQSAVLQLVGVGNGPIQQSPANAGGPTAKTKILWWPVAVLLVLMVIAYWLGRKHQLRAIKHRLKKGETPF